jgi:O-succinylbenzoic acid--CoA ligase
VVAGTEPVAEMESVTHERGYISLVPTQLQRFVLGGDPSPLTRFAAVLIGGGPLSPSVRSAAEAAGIRVVQTYGMSETCGGCVYDGRPLDGVDVRIEDGEVLLRGPMLFDGYEGDPERTASALTDGWFRTDDLGTFEDGRLRVTGRADDVIISGGVKVPARAVAQMIAVEPDVLGVEVLGVPDAEWGERVVAFVSPDNALGLEHLRDLVKPREWAPRQLVLVEEIPLLPNGKPDRVRLRAMA